MVNTSPSRPPRCSGLTAGDPRPSLEARYKNHDGYVKAVTKAADKLQKQRFLLPEDVERHIEEAEASNVLQ